MNALFLSCKKSTELIEKKIDDDISPIEKARLRIHLSMCKACTRFNIQSQFIHNSLLHRKESAPQDTQAIKHSILKKLKEK
jgi:predicted anti-sigma-YlaC factor YlaD